MRERIIRAVAGSMVLVSTLLVYFVNVNWIWLAVFVGANLLQSSFTNFCPLNKILDVIGEQDGAGRKSGNIDNLEKGDAVP